ncbi:MAG: hypothetical protein HC905_05430, partial [Bacteroidales bacterium]|nr:hypothetical protein [Bacteroidales bacterium]
TINRPQYFFNDRWTQTNKTASLPKAGATANTWQSDILIFDGSYLRFKQIQFGYTIPKSITDRIKIGKVRAYVSLDDFITITNYPGFDPEVGTNNGQNNNYGIDRGSYPNSRKVIFGASISF